MLVDGSIASLSCPSDTFAPIGSGGLHAPPASHGRGYVQVNKKHQKEERINQFTNSVAVSEEHPEASAPLSTQINGNSTALV